MKVIEFDDVVLFPLAYDLFCSDLNAIVEYKRDNNCVSIRRMMLERQAREINEIINIYKTGVKSKVFAIDLTNIDSVGDRVLKPSSFAL